MSKGFRSQPSKPVQDVPQLPEFSEADEKPMTAEEFFSSVSEMSRRMQI